MNELLAKAIDAHGGLDRWNKFQENTTTIVSAGGLWPMKNAPLDTNPREMTIVLHEEKSSVLVSIALSNFRFFEEPRRWRKRTDGEKPSVAGEREVNVAHD
jgi:hypothetical protein